MRENGGQYTPAAIWLVMAFAEINDKEKTWELLKMINPVNRGSTEEKIAIYKAEPYVMAADVYAEPLHKGRGGWTWYTGSAGWMYHLILESFIGLNKKGNIIKFHPCIPEDWPSIKIVYNFNSKEYMFEIFQQVNEGQHLTQLFVNGIKQNDMSFTFEKSDPDINQGTIL